jgi:hypothetical protein
MIVFIRHGDDETKEKEKHDTCIRQEGINDIKEKSKELVAKYGQPSLIILSPFRRTVITGYYLFKSLQNKCPVKVWRSVGRFFTSKERKNPLIHKKTICYLDNKEKFKKRCIKVKAKLLKLQTKYPVIWVVTHTLVIKRICNVDEWLPFLYSCQLSA